MPLPVQLTRAELYDLGRAVITQPYNGQNTADRLYEWIDAVIASALIPADDGAPGSGSGSGPASFATLTGNPNDNSSLAAQLRRGPNNRPDLRKQARFYSTASGDGVSVEQLLARPGLLCLGAEIRVELDAQGPNTDYLVIWDNASPRTLEVFRTADFVPGDLIGARLVRKTDKAAGVPSYSQQRPLYNATGPTGYPWTVDELTRHRIGGGGSEFFYAAKGAGPLPAPTNTNGDTNWRRVADEDVPDPPTPVNENTLRYHPRADVVAFYGATELSVKQALDRIGAAFLAGGAPPATQAATPTGFAAGTATTTTQPLSVTGAPAGATLVWQRSSTVDFSVVTPVYTGASLTATATGLTAATNYFYRVKAQVAGLTDSGWVTLSATTASATPAPQPAAPTNGLVDDTANTFTFTPAVK